MRTWNMWAEKVWKEDETFCFANFHPSREWYTRTNVPQPVEVLITEVAGKVLVTDYYAWLPTEDKRPTRLHQIWEDFDKQFPEGVRVDILEEKGALVIVSVEEKVNGQGDH